VLTEQQEAASDEENAVAVAEHEATMEVLLKCGFEPRHFQKCECDWGRDAFNLCKRKPQRSEQRNLAASRFVCVHLFREVEVGSRLLRWRSQKRRAIARGLSTNTKQELRDWPSLDVDALRALTNHQGSEIADRRGFDLGLIIHSQSVSSTNE
jgi:hypothetical protein